MPERGDYFVTSTGGKVALIIRLILHSPVNHAGVYVGGGFIVEGQPGGARLGHSASYPHAIWSTIDLTPTERAAICRKALALQGTQYSFLDIAALAYAKVLKRATPPFIKRRVERSDRLICSQLVDLCYQAAGIHLFADGHPAEDVTPGDLYDLIEKEW